MALERIPADIRRDGGVARMSDPSMILEIKNVVTIPVMAKSRIGHFVESQILEACEIDYIDESEVLTMADEENHIDKTQFNVPFVCGCRDLGEALRRIAEGAAFLRTKGEAGTGNIVEAVRHARCGNKQIKSLTVMSKDELFVAAKDMRAPYELVKYVADNGKLPVVNFAAGGVATPADAALMMQLGMDGVFVGSGIFKSEDPAARAAAIVRAVTHFKDPKVLMEVSTGLGPTMAGPSPVLTSMRTLGSLKCVTARTIAAARAAGSSLLKIPDPTKTPSIPSCIISAASAGVATPPAAKLTTGNLPLSATYLTSSYGARISFAATKSSSFDMTVNDLICLFTQRAWRTASTIFPVPASPFVRRKAAPSAIRRRASPRSRHPHTKGTLNCVLSIWFSSSAMVNTSLSSM